MGVAIVITGADFSAKNLGKVTLLKDIDVTSITINEDGQSFLGIKAQLSASYTPENTSQNVCTWEIVSGEEYAEIDVASGLLTILPSASNNQVVVRATSVYNTDIYSDVAIFVSYAETVEELNAITDIKLDATVENNIYQLSAVFDPENTAYTGVQWTIVSGTAYVSLGDNGKITVLESAVSGADIVVRATSEHDTSIQFEKTLNIQWKEDPVWDFSKMVGTIDLSDGLGELLTNNDVTLFVEFSDDSTYNRLAGYNQVVVSTSIPASSSSAVRYYPGAGVKLIANSDHGMDVSVGGLKGMTYTDGKMSVPVAYGLRMSSPAGSGTSSFPLGCEVIANKENLIVDGNSNEMETNSDVREGYYQYLSFGFAIAYDLNIGIGKSCDEVYEEATSAYAPEENLCYSKSDLKPKQIILLPGVFNDRDSIMSNRDSAYVDIRFDADGIPYNAASDKGGVLSIHKF